MTTDTVGTTPDNQNAGGGAGGVGGSGNIPWYDGASSEEVGYLQNRGLDKMSPKDAALAAIKAHREAEKLIGAPTDKLVRLPKDAADVEGITNLYTKLGVPADEKGYDFTEVKFADGTTVDDAVAADLGKAFRAAGVPKDKASEIIKAIVSISDREEAAVAKAAEDALNAQRDTLKINWGSNVSANLVIAQNTAKALGVTPEQIGALEKTLGYAPVMEMFRNIGTKIGEDQFVTNSLNGGSSQVISLDQARATLDAKMNDTQWAQKLSAGDATAIKEFDNLTRIISGVGR